MLRDLQSVTQHRVDGGWGKEEPFLCGKQSSMATAMNWMALILVPGGWASSLLRMATSVPLLAGNSGRKAAGHPLSREMVSEAIRRVGKLGFALCGLCQAEIRAVILHLHPG